MKTRYILAGIGLLVLVMIISLAAPSPRVVLANKDLLKEGSVPTLLAPSGTIVDKTPTYKWTKISGATKYQYRLYRSAADIPLWTKTVEASGCGAVYCTRTPIDALINAKYNWQARAYISGAWKAWSAKKTFTVADGFISQFNGSMTGWATKAGGNWQVNSTYLYDNGVSNKWSSVIRDSQEYSNFTFSAKVRQTGGTYDKNEMCIRMGTLVNGTVNTWYPGYGFRYQNNGYYYIIRYNANGTASTIQESTYNSAITDDWNTLKVVANGSNFKYYINGVLLKEFTDSTFSQGYVGFQWMKMGTYEGQYQVDWAKLFEIGD